MLLAVLGGCGGGDGGSTTGEPVLASATTMVDGTAVGTPNPTWPDNVTASDAASASGLSCGTPGKGSAYTYTHLNIFVDGVQQQLPANVGWVSPPLGRIPPDDSDPANVAPPDGSNYTCAFPLHTDDNSGKIRFASDGAYTLGQFFAVWGQPLSSTNVAGLTGKPISVYVNDAGRLTKYTGDLGQLALTPKRDISIVVGDTKPAQIANYAWTDPAPLNPTPIDVVAGQTIGTPAYALGDTANGGQGQPVDGLTCGGMGSAYHVHTHVAIIKNQVAQQQPTNIIAFPAGVGIVGAENDPNRCFYPIHVHDSSGVIHVEAPGYQRMTLGQLFAIWGMPLSATEAADSNGAPVAFFISDGGDVRQYMGDPRDIELLSHRSITIQIGESVQTIPSFNWITYNEPR
ncbi:hypothetical protein [Thermithiobacillus plumbiphilus]|uniref:YHYH domain-containing protein n=1 Tax=Thermithiobacillus plumbiphilus TaxID=1729899 RepID=A0ABU9D7V2_9PROT